MNQEMLQESDAKLYDKIMAVMENQKPYKKSGFEVNMLAGLVNSNRTYISRAINRISGKNFYGWIAEYRSHIIMQELQKNPLLTVDELCALTGIANRETLSRQFKQLNGITLSEFRKSQR